MELREDLKNLFRAASVLNSDALFLYDRSCKRFVLSDIRSRAVEEALAEHGDIFGAINHNNHFLLEDLSATGCWQLSRSPTQGRLSMNVSLDRRRMFFVNVQLVGVDIALDDREPRYLLCSLKFSARKEEDITFVDRDHAKLWHYDPTTKRFQLMNIIPLTYHELEVVRLSRMGYTEREISSILHKSLDTIRWYKRNIYEKLGVKNIQACIAYCEVYHIL